MDIGDLERFVLLAEELNYRRAAERLGISQQRLSQRIMDLETRLGLRLLDRTTRSVTLTAAGASFLSGTRETLASMQRSIRSAQLAARGCTGRITIAVSGFSLEGTLPFLLRRFHDIAPHVELDLREMESGAQEDALLSGTVDVGFGVVEPRRRDVLRYDVIATDGFVVVAADNSDERSELSPKDLREQPLVLTRGDVEPLIRAAIMRAFHDAGVEPRVVEEARQKTVLFGFVVAGLGLAIVPSSARSFQRLGIRYMTLHTNQTTSLSMISRIDNSSAILPALRDVMTGPASIDNSSRT